MHVIDQIFLKIKENLLKIHIFSVVKSSICINSLQHSPPKKENMIPSKRRVSKESIEMSMLAQKNIKIQQIHSHKPSGESFSLQLGVSVCMLPSGHFRLGLQPARWPKACSPEDRITSSCALRCWLHLLHFLLHGTQGRPGYTLNIRWSAEIMGRPLILQWQHPPMEGSIDTETTSQTRSYSSALLCGSLWGKYIKTWNLISVLIFKQIRVKNYRRVNLKGKQWKMFHWEEVRRLNGEDWVFTRFIILPIFILQLIMCNITCMNTLLQ